MNHPPKMSGSKAKILIVDDEAANMRGLVRLLESEGYESCIGFTDPSQAVAEFLSISPDLLLLDWHMEPMNGLEVLAALRGKFSDTFLPPIIVLTADCCPETKKQALSAGVSDFLSKPFDHSEVLLRIRNLLRLRHLLEQVELEKQRLEEIVFERTAELRRTLSELKEVQQQVIEQDRMRALAAMAGGVAHDFNNSLMVIRGYSELYGSSQANPCTIQEMKEAFDTIALASHDAGEIVRRLREFYKPFNEPVEIRQTVYLNKLLEESVDLTRPKWETQTRAAGLCVSIRLELSGEPEIFAAPTEIREAMMNLIFNAVDAMPQGGQIVIRTRILDEQAQIDIEDTGTGMTEVTRRRCLEPFYTTKGDRGTGLGLSIIYGILHRHDGNIRIKSELNQGTCMTITLPLAPRGLHTLPFAPAAAETLRLRVLMVDDDPQICVIISRFLETDRHEVTVASNGCEALEKFTSNDYDVVITDRVMPKMSGDQLAVAIRSIRPLAPIILLTGFETQNVPKSVDLLLSKPATIDDLRGALTTVVSSSKEERITAMAG